MRLRQNELPISPETALEQLRQVQHHEVQFDPNRPAIRGVSRLKPKQLEALHGLALKRPEIMPEMTLLSGL